MSSGWGDERIERLKKFIEEGLSATQISIRFEREGVNVTRNAVLSVIHRRGLAHGLWQSTRKTKGGGSRVSRAQRTAAQKKREPALSKVAQILFKPEPFVASEELHIPLNERKSLLDLEQHDCRWPIGDPRAQDFHFCGKSKVTGLPYCEFHVRRAYVPPRLKQPVENDVVPASNLKETVE